MHFKDFIAKYTGKFVDYDGYYGAQCVDLFRFYCKEVLGIGQPKGVGGARELWLNFESDPVLSANFTKIPNTPDFVPIPGDVWIWTNQYGKYGHVAITSYGAQTVNQFECFSQNDPTGSACVLKKYSYKCIYGVLRPKNHDNLVISNLENTTSTESEDEMNTLEFLGCKTFKEAEQKLIEHLGIEGNKCGWGDDSRDNTGGHLGSERRKVKALEAKITQLEADLTREKATVKTDSTELTTLKSDKAILQNQVSSLQLQVATLQKELAESKQGLLSQFAKFLGIK